MLRTSLPDDLLLPLFPMMASRHLCEVIPYSSPNMPQAVVVADASANGIIFPQADN